MDISLLIWWFAAVGFMLHVLIFIFLFSQIKSSFDAMEMNKISLSQIFRKSPDLSKAGEAALSVLLILTLALINILGPIFFVLKYSLKKSLYVKVYKLGREMSFEDIRKNYTERKSPN